MTELTVTIKGESQTYKQKFLLYETYTCTYGDPVILKCIEEAKNNAKIEPDDIKVRIVLQVK